jgi:cytochrome c
MRSIPFIAAVLCLQLFIPSAASAEAQRATLEEALARVHEAVELLEDNGEAALPMINDPSAGFVWKDTYVFVVDCDADRVRANPAFPERVGGDIKQHTDYAGKQYGLELCKTAARPGGGWLEYVWLKAGGKTPLRKISYVTSVAGKPYQLGAGIYDEATSVAELDAMSKRRHPESHHAE